MQPDAVGKAKLPMWHQYRVELYPVFEPPFQSLSAKGTSRVTIDEFFRRTRDGRRRGVVQIIRESVQEVSSDDP